MEIPHSNEDIAYAYIAYLNSKLVETLISHISSHVGGGQWDLSPKYINHLPIIDMSVVSAGSFKSLIDFGKSFANGQANDIDRLDEICGSIFTENE